MPSFSLTVLGVDVSFKADVEQERVEAAKRLVEERFRKLEASGRQLGREKLLLFAALGLADDVETCNRKLERLESGVVGLLAQIDAADVDVRESATDAAGIPAGDQAC